MATIEVTRRTFVVQASSQHSAISTQPNQPNQTSASPRPGSPESPVLAFWGGRLRGEIGGRQ
jgi:hypothetical protein